MRLLSHYNIRPLGNGKARKKALAIIRNARRRGIYIISRMNIAIPAPSALSERSPPHSSGLKNRNMTRKRIHINTDKKPPQFTSAFSH